jgi:polysaccharide export outer membrane protein
LVLFILLRAAPLLAADGGPGDARKLAPLGAGDTISIQVYGQPDMSTTVYIGDDGTVSVPLAGPVQVGGLSPVEAAKRVEMALKNGQFLIDPHVTVAVVQSRSQRVSVLGEVRLPGRYPLDPGTTVLDVLAQAGGLTATAADVVYILRADAQGKETRYPVNTKAYTDSKNDAPALMLQTGDSVFVPTAEQFYIYGEVTSSNKYRVEPNMTVIQAIKRMGADGKYTIIRAKPNDLVKADDVIRVKESIF